MNDGYYKTHAKALGSGAVAEGQLLTLIEGASGAMPTSLAIFADAVEMAATEQLASELAEGERLSRLLEVRAFGKEAELHAVRTALGTGFTGRIIEDDETLGKEDHLTETQFLDIVRNENGHCTTIGGGTFDLPRGYEDASAIEVRNYIEYDAEGIARVVDFRIVKLEKGVDHAEKR